MHRSRRAPLLVLTLVLAVASWLSAPALAAPARAALATAALAARAQPAPHAFLATFDGRPAAPEPWHGAGWDVTVHSRDRETWQELEPIAAHHGGDCSAPPNTHLTTSYEDAVYLCNNHLMTAINAGGYGVVYLTPNQQIDFSTGEAVVTFDLSTLRSSSRDWVDLWLTPYDDHLQLPLDSFLPDLLGEPRRSVHLRLGSSNGQSHFSASVFRGGVVEELKGQWWTGYESVLTPSAVRRDPFELRISRTSLKVGMPTYNLWWLDERFADLGWDRAVVQFGHHSYTPAKDCAACGPNTWHWDTVGINPAVPFTIISGQQRWASDARGTTVTFPAPAPADSHLRFAAIGSGITVSFDGGASWQAAQPRPVREGKDPAGAFLSYWTPIPSGVSSVQLQGGSWRGGLWAARDFSIWSLEAPADPAPASPGEDGPTD
ncbi:MAG: hypothetical protein IT306_20260 [Chloroflexi bacterium]|nr:hypothetical protein [Chloroflexota bacterium]